MTVKTPDDTAINGQHLRTIVDTIPDVICQFYARRTGESGLDRTLSGTPGHTDEKNAGAIISNDGIIIQKPEGT
jgi:hypothetical protein